jgi:hypothetical protein
MEADSPLKPRDKKHIGSYLTATSAVADKKTSDDKNVTDLKAKKSEKAADDDIMTFLMDDSNFKDTLK